MGYDIQGPGPYTLLSAVGPTTGVPTVSTGLAGTTSQVGAWKSVSPDVGRLTFSARLTASSIGATATSSGQIQFSMDGVTPINTLPGSFQLSGVPAGTTLAVADGFAPPSSMQGAWPYVRVNLQSLTPATAQDTAVSSIPSTGQPAVTVTAAGGWRT